MKQPPGEVRDSRNNLWIGCVFVDNRCPIHGTRARAECLWATALLMQAHIAQQPWWRRWARRILL
jgi:hypothetical protein